MSTTKPRILLRLAYAEAAQEYLRSLPLEHFMEATTQVTQRKITLESLDLVRPEPIDAEGSFDTHFQPAGPFCVLEYVSTSNRRKDYDDNMRKYERELKVPYYLLFYPEAQELTLYHHNKRKYLTVKPDKQGRLAIPELELEAALLESWVRFWYQDELLPLPADLLRDLEETRRHLAATQSQLDAVQSQLAQERQGRRAAEEELARLRAQLAQPRRMRGADG
jgi:hypothetical protein